MDIVIFDDDPKFINTMKEALDNLNTKHKGIFGTPTYYGNKSDVLIYAEANKDKPVLYLLDITAGGKQTGYELAESIKEISPDNLIIYVTDYNEQFFSNMAHKLLSLTFILKDSGRFSSELEEALLIAHGFFAKEYLVDNSAKTIIKIRIKDIYFFEKKKMTDFTFVVHKNGLYCIKRSLSDIKNRVGSKFHYSSKEFLVNTEAIVQVDKVNKILHFENGAQRPYSKHRQKELFQCLCYNGTSGYNL